MTFSIDNPEGGCNNPPLGKYVWEKPSGEQGLNLFRISDVFYQHVWAYIWEIQAYLMTTRYIGP